MSSGSPKLAGRIDPDADGFESGTKLRAERPPSRYRLQLDDREIELTAEAELLIGRATECGLRLKSGLVSRHHARIRSGEPAPILEDLGSRNGVWVNSTRIAMPTALRHGDLIAIGVESIRVLDQAVIERPEYLSTLPPAPVALAASDADAPDATTSRVRLDALSKRERDVLTLIVRGHTQREMATQLFVSVKTIETHRARLAEKLGCKTRTELVTYAIAAGLLRELV